MPLQIYWLIYSCLFSIKKFVFYANAESNSNVREKPQTIYENNYILFRE